MEDQQILNYKYKGAKTTGVQPANELVKNWHFEENETDEAALAHFMGVVGQKNGLSANDMSHLFPYILRILKSDIPWSK